MNNFLKNTLMMFCLLAVACADDPTAEDKNLYLTSNVTVIIYHIIRDDTITDDSIRLTQDFKNDLDIILSEGFHIGTLDEIVDKLEKNEFVEPTVVIQFDDGLEDHYFAAQELHKRGMIGEFFVPIEFIGTSEHLTWDQMSEMKKMGMRIGSHSYRHTPLGVSHKLSTETVDEYESRITYEIKFSREILGSHGFLTDILALPFASGIHDEIVLQTAQTQGYRIVRGVGNQLASILPNKIIKNIHCIMSDTALDMKAELSNDMNSQIQMP